MAKVRYVSSPAEIPAEESYVLVKYGKENGLHRHDRSFIVTVDESQEPNLREAHTATVIGEAQAMADQENIDTVFVCIPPGRDGRDHLSELDGRSPIGE